LNIDDSIVPWLAYGEEKTLLVPNMHDYQVALIADMSRSDEVEDAVDQTLDRSGQVDVLVNNDAMTRFGS